MPLLQPNASEKCLIETRYSLAGICCEYSCHDLWLRLGLHFSELVVIASRHKTSCLTVDSPLLILLSLISSTCGEDQEAVQAQKIWKKAIMLVWRAAANHRWSFLKTCLKFFIHCTLNFKTNWTLIILQLFYFYSCATCLLDMPASSCSLCQMTSPRVTIALYTGQTKLHLHTKKMIMNHFTWCSIHHSKWY